MVEISGDVTEVEQANKQTWEDRASGLYKCKFLFCFEDDFKPQKHFPFLPYKKHPFAPSNLRDMFVSVCTTEHLVKLQFILVAEVHKEDRLVSVVSGELEAKLRIKLI